MLDSFAAMLRALRLSNHLTVRDLAKLTFISPGHLSNVENGTRAATEQVAADCDAALGSTPLLAVTLSIEKGNAMLRRMLFGGTLGLAGGALLATVDTTAALAATINATLRANTSDYEAITADFTRRYVLASGPDFGPELAAQILVAHQAFTEGDTEAGRCAAQLTLIYGLWIADAGKMGTAHSLYATAAALADNTTDRTLQGWVRARAASRGPYEGWTVRRCEQTAAQALSLRSSGATAVEAYGTMVHLAALTGRLDMGRTAVDAMYAAADGAGLLHARAASFDNYLECRAGSLADARAAHERTAAALAEVPLWRAEARIYLGRALVAAGDVEAGAQMALDAIKACPAATRIVGIGVRDVLAAVPAGVPSQAVAALRGYASPGPAPWETIR